MSQCEVQQRELTWASLLALSEAEKWRSPVLSSGSGSWEVRSAGLSAAGRGHRAAPSGCLQPAAFNGKKKSELASSCSPRMPNPPWCVWVPSRESAWSHQGNALSYLRVRFRPAGCCWGDSCVTGWRSPGPTSDWSGHPEGNLTWLHRWSGTV